ncbi:alanine--tRNA ligase-related protein [Microbacterium sp. RU33B]|uniref:alanine--tRNA ligase-related protein n=1 Tax=Microbacterium sp. RU33B TaxID=1907390 RepID=UPI00095DAD6D|nr:alanine--tRNA ligase-related protein [Microbacterium sp. RU33B]SIT69256.1 alanyl-tRNA synthetase [Microbacterium sp. RU33B]
MTADEIRRIFLEYMAERGHVVIPRAPLIPKDDPTTLFTGSGMQPLLPYLLGEQHPDGTRLADGQTCLRVQDVEEVGDNRHTTFFEMLGNWSLGDYFKQEQIPQVWTFLTEKVGLDPARIYVSCFSGDPEHDIPKDEESAAIWTRLFEEAGVSSDQVDVGTEEHAAAVGTGGARIAFYSKKNWWCRGGKAEDMPVGEPGGPDTEMFYLFPHVEHDPAYGEHCHQNCDCGRFIELGNSVFMEYRKTETGFEPLPRRNVDYGGGLARIAAAAIDSPDVFRIGLLWPIIERLEELSGASYETETRAMRVIADHLRGATFLAVDGVRPGNKAQGYVMRRLIRRAVRFAFDLGLEENFFPQIIPTIAGIYEEHFPEVGLHAQEVEAILAKEEQSFRRTLRKGLKQLKAYAADGVTGRELFVLSDTYGFPVELSTEEVARQGISLSEHWRDEFDEELAAQRARSQRASLPAS